MVPAVPERGSRREIHMMLLKIAWWLFATLFGLFYAWFALMYYRTRIQIAQMQLLNIQLVACSILCGTFRTQRHNVVCFIDPFPHSISSVVHF